MEYRFLPSLDSSEIERGSVADLNLGVDLLIGGNALEL